MWGFAPWSAERCRDVQRRLSFLWGRNFPGKAKILRRACFSCVAGKAKKSMRQEHRDVEREREWWETRPRKWKGWWWGGAQTV